MPAILEHDFPALGKRRMRLNARPVRLDDTEGAALILLGFQDVTEAPPP